MRKILYIACVVLLCGWFTGCTLEDLTGDIGDKTAFVTVQMTFPDDFKELFPDHPMQGGTIEIRNTVTGSAYYTKTDEEGRITQQVEYGSYNIFARKTVNEGEVTVILAGGASLRVLDDSDLSDPIVIDATMSFLSPLIFSEIYYTSSNDANGNNYTAAKNDRYFVVYNNSGETQYADGIGFWTHSSSNAGTSQTIGNWFKADTKIPRDSLPTSWGGYVIPGNGTDHPIEPGGEIIIAFNGIDHPNYPGTAQGPLFVNLDRDNVWVPWHSGFTGSVGKGVRSKLMYTYKTGAGTSFIISNGSPSMAIYRMQDFAEVPQVEGKTYYEALADKYIAGFPVSGARSNPVVYNPPEYTKGSQHILIPWQWVMDGLEVFLNKDNYHRLPSMVDSGYIPIPAPASFSGRTLVRKVDWDATAAAGGRIVYQDTNNALEDWEVLDAPTLLYR